METIALLLCTAHSGGDVTSPCGKCAEVSVHLAALGWTATPPAPPKADA